MPRYGFPVNHRLTDKSDFDRVFKSRNQAFRSRGLLALCIPNEQAGARLGMTVARKHAGNAVRRNRVRRQLREVFRRSRPELPAFDIVVIVRRDFGSIPEEQWHALCQQLFQRIIAARIQEPNASG